MNQSLINPDNLVFPSGNTWMTVGELKKELEGLPDNVHVVLTTNQEHYPLSFARTQEYAANTELELYSTPYKRWKNRYRFHITWPGRKDPYIGHKYFDYASDDAAIKAIPEIEKGYADGDLKAVCVEIERVVPITGYDDFTLSVWTNHGGGGRFTAE